MPSFSVLVPVYNEAKTIKPVLDTVCSMDFIDQVIVVDDGSKDGSFEIVQSHKSPKIQSYKLSENQGKTAAINFALKHATTEIVAIQDADLEYDPTELQEMLIPIEKGVADVVYGSRFLVKKASRVLYFYHYLANKFITFFSNCLTNYNMTDIETCYKVFRREILDDYSFSSKGFGMEVELTALFAHLNCRVYECPISYYGRTYEDGKKIGLKDGVWALVYIVFYNIIAPKCAAFKQQKLIWNEKSPQNG